MHKDVYSTFQHYAVSSYSPSSIGWHKNCAPSYSPRSIKHNKKNKKERKFPYVANFPDSQPGNCLHSTGLGKEKFWGISQSNNLRKLLEILEATWKYNGLILLFAFLPQIPKKRKKGMKMGQQTNISKEGLSWNNGKWGCSLQKEVHHIKGTVMMSSTHMHLWWKIIFYFHSGPPTLHRSIDNSLNLQYFNFQHLFCSETKTRISFKFIN